MIGLLVVCGCAPAALAPNPLDPSQDFDGDGFAEVDGDCDDSEPSAFPGGVEACGNDVDEDCDGVVLACDDDGDGYTEDQGDCDDDDPTRSPGLAEICSDGIDNDCDELEVECALAGHHEAPADSLATVDVQWLVAAGDHDLDGRSDVVVASPDLLQVVQLAGGQLTVRDEKSANGSGFASVAVSPDGRWLAVGILGGDGEVQVFDRNDLQNDEWTVHSGMAGRHAFGEESIAWIATGPEAEPTGLLVTSRLPSDEYHVEVVPLGATVSSGVWFDRVDVHATSGLVLGAGDLDGVAGAEFVIGDPGHSFQPREPMRILVYDEVGSVGSFEDDKPRSGVTLVAPGDLDGDGYGDLLVGSAGDVFLFPGRFEWSDNIGFDTAMAHWEASDSRLGESIAMLGDADGDGTPEFAAGTVGNEVYVFHAAVSGRQEVDDAFGTISGPAGWSGGTGLAGADLDGDGFDDLVIRDRSSLRVLLGGTVP
ncbi:MAG: putative metal-binding motif-containing protein [Myxococcales bacterium]|nr:putative metal-binding motif-containing protein [Myxococcales bacterium]